MTKSARTRWYGSDIEGRRAKAWLRPASFECLTFCPTGAYPPVHLRKPGWDRFEDGVWLCASVRGTPWTGA